MATSKYSPADTLTSDITDRIDTLIDDLVDIHERLLRVRRAEAHFAAQREDDERVRAFFATVER